MYYNSRRVRSIHPKQENIQQRPLKSLVLPCCALLQINVICISSANIRILLAVLLGLPGLWYNPNQELRSMQLLTHFSMVGWGREQG